MPALTCDFVVLALDVAVVFCLYLHLFGGLVALLYIALEAWRYRLGPAKRTLVEVTALYWHFMDGLWIYILLLLWFWR